MTDPLNQTDSAADRIRDGLLITLKELDRRRHHATDVRYQLQHHTLTYALVGASVVLVVGGLITANALRKRSARKHVVQRRLRGLTRAWEHPERLATKAEQKPLPLEVGRKLASTALIAIGTQLIKSALERANPAPIPRDAGAFDDRA